MNNDDTQNTKLGVGRSGCRCSGCGSVILDQYILRVSPDLEWHASCLKCAECGQFLDEMRTCFVRDGKTFCKTDYLRLYGTKCSRCGLGFNTNDLVMRARTQVYHVDCFRCVACSRPLVPGDEFALREDGLFCRADHDHASTYKVLSPPDSTNSEEVTTYTTTTTTTINNNNNNNENKGSLSGSDNSHGTTVTGTSSSGSGATGTRSGSRLHKSDQKTTRVRTVLNEKQLHTLRTCYGANPRPDALMKEQLVEMTGLSPRVIRVWFQNKRCKDKKRSMLMKQLQQQQQQQDKNDVCALDDIWMCHKGVPMVASSPVRHESPGGGHQPSTVEVHPYQAPWKALTEFALQNEIHVDQAPFQQLVSSFGGGGGGSGPGVAGESTDDDDDTVVSLEERSRGGHRHCIKVQQHQQQHPSLYAHHLVPPSQSVPPQHAHFATTTN